MKQAIAVLFLGCISSVAFADAADQATLKVYKMSSAGHEADLSDLKADSLVLQQAEPISSAEAAAAPEQSFDLGGSRYSYSVSYAPASDYEASSLKLTVEGAKGAAKSVDNVTLHSGKITMVQVGEYVLAFTMEPAVD